MEDDPRIPAMAASDLVSASVLASLIGMLGAKDILSDGEVREIYVQALLLLEEQQGGDDSRLREVYEAARSIIGAQLL